MAIVQTYQYPGVTVHIDDDCYAGASPEEMKDRIARVQNTAWEILRKMEEKGNEKAL